MRAVKRLALSALVSAIAAPAAFAWGDDCEFRKANVDAAGVTKVAVKAAAGDLKVHGNAADRRIEANGVACATSKAVLDQLQVSVRREGTVVYVETQMPQDQSGGWGNDPYIDLGVTLPGDIDVEATDSSGDADFADLKSLAVQDSSGDLTLKRIAGAVVVNDSSGEIEIEKAGSVRVDDSSGDIEIDDVRGDVVVANDSSGDIEIARVDANVLIQQDSSGGIRVEDVRGNVTIDNDSSGDIYAARVKGDFTVKNDGSGSIGHSAIGGRISVPREE
jgi:DUF4097 and DUF4098 domain-containing protein YvlB